MNNDRKFKTDEQLQRESAIAEQRYRETSNPLNPAFRAPLTLGDCDRISQRIGEAVKQDDRL